jgi:TM2 domain-containing membrane protein YozV
MNGLTKPRKKRKALMIEIILYGIIGLFIICVWMMGYDWYKDKEWRRNNPEEHNIMERKIKDDFSE